MLHACVTDQGGRLGHGENKSRFLPTFFFGLTRKLGHPEGYLTEGKGLGAQKKFDFLWRGERLTEYLLISFHLLLERRRWTKKGKIGEGKPD